jgi:hypothetical protein
MPKFNKRKWTIKELLDLDYFLYLRRKNYNSSDLNADRKFFREKMDSYLEKQGKSSSDQNDIIHAWLRAKSSEFSDSGGSHLPGDFYESSFKTIILLFSFFAFVSGLSAVFAFLSYTGSAPVNVFYFFILFAGIHLFLLPFALLPFFAVSKEKIIKKFSFFSPLYSMIKFTTVKYGVKLSKKFSPDKFNNFSYTGLSKYREPFFWLIFSSAQLIFVLFSAGVLFGTFLKVLGSDLAFGWQTTLSTGPEYIHRLVAVLASPWSWFVPDSLAVPSLEEVRGSRIVLKEGIASLSTSDMVSWWPFLCFSVLFYAVIPRFAIMSVSCFFYLRSMKNQPPDSSELRQLARDLTTPEVGFFHEDSGSGSKIGDMERSVSDKKVFNAGNTDKYKEEIRLIVPEDIYSESAVEVIEKSAVKKFGFLSGPVFKSTGVSDIDMDEFGKNPEFLNNRDKSIFMVCFEAWQPPLKQTADYLLQLRQIIGSQAEIIVVLIGKPAENGFLNVRENDFSLWDSKIKRINDPLIKVFKLDPE